MAEAAAAFVPLRQLQERAAARIAELAGVEAALISAGAASGIALAIAGCLTDGEPERVLDLPATGPRREVIVARAERPNYMYQAATVVGAQLVPVGSPTQLSATDIAAAIGPATAAVLLIVAPLDHQRASSPGVTLTIEAAAAVTRPAGVPLIVDAAAELPPTDNLRAFLRQGADLVIFSGGKGLRGPQASGLLLGRADLIAAAAANNNPSSAVGRPHKVGKEEIAGLVRAVELFVTRDEAAEARTWRASIDQIAAGLADLPGIQAEVVVDGRYARPPVLPCCLIHLTPTTATPAAPAVDRTPVALAAALLAGTPAVAVGTFATGLIVNPIAIVPGQEPAIIDRLRACLAG
jgi:L-seryl-tRNA(Ser) seleniumtransferase